MPEQTMTAGQLIEAYDAYRTQHMATRTIPGAYDQAGKPQTEDILVLDAEVQHGGQWCKVRQVGTDKNDKDQPVYLDLEGAERQVLAMGDSLTVRGLTEADPWAGPSSR